MLLTPTPVTGTWGRGPPVVRAPYRNRVHAAETRDTSPEFSARGLLASQPLSYRPRAAEMLGKIEMTTRLPRTEIPEKTTARALEMYVPEPNSGCWLWIGSYAKTGYGMVNTYLAHRVIYQALVGPIPESTPHLDHLCRVRCCVNPAHLEPVTPKENAIRGVGFAGHHHRATCCPKGHPYDTENTVWRKTDRGLQRSCRICRGEAFQRWAKKHRQPKPRVRILKAECKYGHPLSGDNVRISGKDGRHRECLACEKRRNANRYLRQPPTS